MGEVADLWAAVGARVDRGSWARADSVIVAAQRKLDGLTGSVSRFNGAYQDIGGKWRHASGQLLTLRERSALAKAGIDGIGASSERAGRRAIKSFGGIGTAFGAMGAILGGRLAYGALVKFNATAEDARLQIAGMLSLARKTDLKDQVGAAEKLYARLQKRAAALPGSTAEYVAMAGKLTRVVINAGGSVQDLENLTVNAVVAAKGLGEQWEVAARDIEQALMGRFNTTDPFTAKVLGAQGFVGEEGRARFRALSPKKRFEAMKAALMAKQFTQLGEAQGKTFTGLMDQAGDAVKQFFGRIGKPLFDALKTSLQDLSKWFDENRERIMEMGQAIGEKLVSALGALWSVVSKVFGFLAEHGEMTKSILIAIGAALAAFAIQAAAAWIAAFAPVVAVIAVVAAIVYAIRQLQKHPDKVRAAFRRMWDGIKGALSSVWDSIKAFGDRIWKFFTEDIPNAIKAAFQAAFDFIASMPVIRQILDAIAWARGGHGASTGNEKKLRDLAVEDEKTLPKQTLEEIMAPSYPKTLPPGAGGVPHASLSVDVGGINVSSPNADPRVVATEVGRVFDERMAGMLRQTMDVIG